MMRLARELLLVTASLTAAGCAAGPGNVEIRPIADPAAKLRQGSGDLAEAKSMLALGSVGLALEAFRRVQRQQPTSADAFAGIASCYAAMGRYDLARSNDEAALALAPSNPALLNALADVLDRQGKGNEATAARAEAARLANSAKAVSPTPANAAAPVETAAAEARGTTAPIAPELVSTATIASPSVTVQLPPARPVQKAAAASPSTRVSPQSPAPAPSPAPMQVAQSSSPRLERLSPGEVALLTSGRPMWSAQVVARTRLSTTVRWIPIESAHNRPNIQLLNAAHRQGLAARTRDVLFERGWRRIDIGNAAQLREKSVVLYPAARSALGRSLALQFGFRAIPSEGDVLVILLGRDAAALRVALRHG
jgi:tetratricopeptide (TPR) repeat protein